MSYAIPELHDTSCLGPDCTATFTCECHRVPLSPDPVGGLREALSQAVQRAGLYEIADAMTFAILDGTFADAPEDQVRHAVYELVAKAAVEMHWHDFGAPSPDPVAGLREAADILDIMVERQTLTGAVRARQIVRALLDSGALDVDVLAVAFQKVTGRYDAPVLTRAIWTEVAAEYARLSEGAP